VLGSQLCGILTESFNSSRKKRMYLSTNACKIKGISFSDFGTTSDVQIKFDVDSSESYIND
jgi:hypothetical protein